AAEIAIETLARVKLGHGNSERNRDEFVGADHDAHVAAGTLPALGRTVDVPAPIHLHMRVEMKIAGELDDEVLAGGDHALDRASLQRRLVIDARELRQQ